MSLILFSIIVKVMAAIYLFVYYLLVDPLSIVLVSGFTDAMMAVAIVWGRRNYRSAQQQESVV